MSDRPVTSLRGLIHVKHGFPFKGEHFKSAGPYVVLTPGNFHEKGGFKRNAEKDKCYSESFPEEYLLKRGSVIVAMTEQTDGLLGSTAIIPESGKFLHNQRLGLITSVAGEVLPEFIYHSFKTQPVREQIRRSASGSKVKHTSPDRIYDVRIPLPSVTEQEAIARFLTALDDKIDLNHRINAELEAMAKLLYDYWFVQFDFPISAAQAAALGTPGLEGQPFRSSGGKMTHHPDLKREIPAIWKADNLLQLAELGGGGTPNTKNPDYWSGHIPFFTPTDAEAQPFKLDTEQRITLTGLENSSTKVYPPGTLFVTARGSVGKIMIIATEMAMNQSCYALCPNEGVNSPFLYFHALALVSFLRMKSSGSIFKSIVTSDIKFSTTVIPDVETISRFGEVAAPMFEQILNNQRQNQELAALRDWLLPMLMNGQVTVG